jgi:hypothetical protein
MSNQRERSRNPGKAAGADEASVEEYGLNEAHHGPAVMGSIQAL